VGKPPNQSENSAAQRKTAANRKSDKPGKRTGSSTNLPKLTALQRRELIRSLTDEERLTETNYAGVARILGISVRNFQHYMAQGCPGRPASSSKQDGIFFLPEIIQWCKTNVWKSKQRIEVDEFGDPMVPVGDPNSSPALEKYREWRARLAELDYYARKEKLIDVTKVHTALVGIAQSLRLAGEQMKREHGNGPVEILNDALRDMEEQIAEHFEACLAEENSEDQEDLDDSGD